MEIRQEETEKLFEDILNGVKVFFKSGNIRRLVLLAGSLEEMIRNGGILESLSEGLDEAVPWPVHVDNKRSYKRIEGDYSVDLESYAKGKFYFNSPRVEEIKENKDYELARK
jgi:hypothetical protein